MSEVGSYILLALALSAVLGVIGASAHPALSREVEMAIGALCLASLAVPVILALPALSKISPELRVDASASSEDYERILEEAFSRGAEGYIAESFSLSADDISVRTEGFDPSLMRAEAITVTLSGGAVLADLSGIRDAVEDELVAEGGKCRVEVRFDE